jgi:predicted metal-dependent peptidase
VRLDLDKLAAAKLWLISPVPAGASPGPDGPRDLPYLAHALYALIPIASGQVPRATCDERWRVSINPDWLDTATVPEVGRELAHLVWHLLGDHAARARDQQVDTSTAEAWHRAADAAIEHALRLDRVAPEHLTTAADLFARERLSAEEYFAIVTGMPADGGGDGGGGALLGPEDGCGSGADGLPRSHELPADADLGEVSTADAREVRRLVAIEYRDRAGARGDAPGEALRWIREVLDPVVPWESLLAVATRRAIGTAAGRGEYTYARPSRRAGALPGFVLPGQRRPVPRVSVVIDTSASVDDGLLSRALGELDGAIAALGVAGSHLTVYSVDAAVHTAQRLTKARDAVLVGAGGTDLRLGLRAIEAQRPRPDVVIVFTDGDTPWPPAPPPGARVVVGILGRRGQSLQPTPPWVVRVECLLDD